MHVGNRRKGRNYGSCVSILSKEQHVVQRPVLPPARPEKVASHYRDSRVVSSPAERVVDSNFKVKGTDDDEAGKRRSILLCILHAHATHKILPEIEAGKNIYCSIEHSRHDHHQGERTEGGMISRSHPKGMMRKR